ncbi:hypothetical protein JCM11251_001091 [Rhodosporidiobolus azoricus]
MLCQRRRATAWLFPLAYAFLAVATVTSPTSAAPLTTVSSIVHISHSTAGGASVDAKPSEPAQAPSLDLKVTGTPLTVADWVASVTSRSAKLEGLANPGRVLGVETATVGLDIEVEAKGEEEEEESVRSSMGRVSRTSFSSTTARQTSFTLSSFTTTTRNRSTPTTSSRETASRPGSTPATNSTLSITSSRRSSAAPRTRSASSTTARHRTSPTATSITRSDSTTTRRAKLTTTGHVSSSTTGRLSQVTSKSTTTTSVHKHTTTKEATQTRRPEKHKKPSSISASQSSTVKPSPTSYGAASSSRSCVTPPSTFAGTNEGFANLCTVRYCDAEKVRNLVWEGNDGPVTRNEIETALGMLGNIEPVWHNGQGNILSDGKVGQGLENAGLLFEITGDIRALDVVVRIADNILALQNQNSQDPVVIWTGDVDPVWPTGELYPTDGSLVYAGCESGLIAGHMVSAAVMILKSPCLWHMVPPPFNGPTSFNDSVTYYDRAMTYIAAGDDFVQNFYFRFLTPDLSMIQPADERWWATGDTRDPGTAMPWNRRMMASKVYLKLAAAHETEAAFEPNLTSYYDRIVQRNVGDFLAELNETRAVQNGVATFDWNYSAGEEHTEESQGVHAYFDIWGAWIAWQRNSATFGLSNYLGQTFANTFEHTISIGNGSFSGLVTGHSTKKAYEINTLWGGWSFYAYWEPNWYDTLATANVDVGFGGRTWLAIPLLWTKHALHINDLTFWSGRFSSGYGVVTSTYAPDTASQTSGACPSLLSPPFLLAAVAIALLVLS